MTCHWNDGIVPPFTAAAVNVTDVPWQTMPVGVLTDTETGRWGLTVIPRVFDMAGLPLAQAKLEVRIHWTWSALAGI